MLIFIISNCCLCGRGYIRDSIAAHRVLEHGDWEKGDWEPPNIVLE